MAASDADAPHEYRYWAFISYSSKDRPRQFRPLFRDRDELPASADLGERIGAALNASRYLIVLCSPNSARSRWVDKEIETFRQPGREDRIFAVIVEGEPNAGNDQECFPPRCCRCCFAQRGLRVCQVCR